LTQEKSKNAGGFKNVYVLQELDMPDAPRIKELDVLLGTSLYQRALLPCAAFQVLRFSYCLHMW